MSIIDAPVPAGSIQCLDMFLKSPIPLASIKRRWIPIPRRSKLMKSTSLGDSLIRQILALEGIEEVFYDTSSRFQLLVVVQTEHAVAVQSYLRALAEQLRDVCHEAAGYMLAYCHDSFT